MIILLAGILCTGLGVYWMSYKPLIEHLQSHDTEQWQHIKGSGAQVLTPNIALFSWVLAQQFRVAANARTRELGADAFKQAKRARDCMLIGVILMAAGFALVLFG